MNSGFESRYQSYTTLPRPEKLDYDQRSNHGSEVIHLNKQMSMIYNPYITKPSTDTQVFFAQADPASNRVSIAFYLFYSF